MKTKFEIPALSLLKDPKFYLENFCKIKTKKPGLNPFILNEAQKDLYNTLKNYCRIIILKARQIGFSTAVTGWMYHNTITTPGITTALIGYNSDMTTELLDKVKTFYRTTPDELKPTIHYNSKYEISFPKLESKILVLPSTENVGKGYTIHNCLLTELSSWEKAEEKMMVLEASVPIDGKIVVESTPHGQGNLYHRMWMNDNNSYIKKEYGWWWHYSETDIDIIRKRMNDPRRFAQEYGLEFLSSGRNVFDTDIIGIQRGNVLNIGDTTEDNTVVKEMFGGLTVYKLPRQDGIYCVGADVAEGVSGGDYSVAIIFDRKTGEEVAFFRGYLPPDIFAERLNIWGRFFNNALMVVEINNHGLTTLTVLKQRIYPSLYFRPAKFEGLSSQSGDKMGWKTTQITRPLLIDDFAQAVRDNQLKLHSKKLLDEMSVFVYDDNGNMSPQGGFHDDTIFAAGIAFQGFKVLYHSKLQQLDYRRHMPRSFVY